MCILLQPGWLVITSLIKFIIIIVLVQAEFAAGVNKCLGDD